MDQFLSGLIVGVGAAALVMAMIYRRDTAELKALIERIKRMP